MARNDSHENSTSNTNVIWLSAVVPSQFDLIGFKALNLSVAKRVNLPVPPSFCITTQAYRQALTDIDLDVAQLNQLAPKTILEYANTIQQKLYQTPLPSEVHADIRSAYRNMMRQNEFPLALRPSLPYDNEADFSRMLRPMLNVKGIIEFERALKICWLYMWSPEILEYRFRHKHLCQRFDDLAIVVQPYFDIQSSGALLAYEPASGQVDRFVIESSWGSNESVNRGWFFPDHFVWDREAQKIHHHKIAHKSVGLFVNDDNVLEERPIDTEKQTPPSLGRKDLHALSQMTEKLVKAYKRTVELEWIKTAQKIYILEFRPSEPFQNQELASQGQPIPGQLPYFNKIWSPMGWSIIHPLLEASTRYVLNHFDVEESSIPQPLFLLDKTPKVLPFLGMALQEILNLWRQTCQEPELKTWLRLGRDAMSSQQFWKERYHTYIQEIKTFWELDLMALTPEQALEKLSLLQETLNDFFEAAIYIRLMSAGLKQLFHEFVLPEFVGVSNVENETALWEGLPSRQTSAFTALAELLHRVKETPELASLFRQHKGKALRAALEAEPQGLAFMTELRNATGSEGFVRAFLDPYHPTWIEEPSLVLEVLQLALLKNMSFWQTPKEEARETATETLSSHIPKMAVHRQFALQYFLSITQKYTALENDEGHYISMFVPVLRKLLSQLAKSLPFHSEQDIYFLTLDELKAILKSNLTSESIQDWAALIRARKYSFRFDSQAGKIHPRLTLAGFAASGGKCLGKVSFVKSSTDLEKVDKGDILVTDFFEPYWVHVLPKLSAIVTESGGSLSHAGRVGRSFQIPVVTGVKDIFRRLKPGQTVQVDGALGEVHIFDDKAFADA